MTETEPRTNAPSPFKQQEWVRYTQEQTSAAILVVLGTGMLVFGGVAKLVLPIAAGTIMFYYAPRYWRLAQSTREAARHRQLGENAFAVVVASTILSFLERLAEEGPEADT